MADWLQSFERLKKKKKKKKKERRNVRVTSREDEEGLGRKNGQSKLPEEIAEEEDLAMYGFGFGHDHEHGGRDHDFRGESEMSTLGSGHNCFVDSCNGLLIIGEPGFANLPDLFASALLINLACGCAIFDATAGAMLGDAFLHQLPHAFVPLESIRLTEISSHYQSEEVSGKYSHSHHHADLHDSGHSHSHSHSLEDLSIGLSILSGIVLFLLVEKVVRYVEDHSGKEKGAWGHSHHHHSHKRSNKVKVDDDAPDNLGSSSSDVKGGKKLQLPSESETPDEVSDGCFNDQEPNEKNVLLRKRVTTNSAGVEDKPDSEPKKAGTGKTSHLSERSPDPSSSNLVFGYLNLFSDGVHNFTDGMALGSAFILHGSVGGWSRTLFLLAHELPQEVGDFGILVRSGFSVSKALFFNFLSALVALAGTALALLLGQDPGQSSLIEGFTAGGFIYISVAGVLPELSNGKSSIRSTLVQATSLVLGMAVALCISLVE
ncbi:hypothetical protein Scep_016269 [Stephania cephalantha]|uniref:IAA-alanine resistance protein 1 n=1 Tax=Stephania cephalantha TaxID=152367 RepID=A0AAP0IMD1_9MAGN